MNPTLQAALAALSGALVVGGAVLAWALSERQQRAQTPPPPAVPDGVAGVLSVLRSSAVLVDENGSVLKASAPAYALGLVRNGRLSSDELSSAVAGCRRDGQIREIELLMTRSGLPDRNVTARIAPLGARLVLALVEDRTRERQVEAVRRDFVANVSHELKTPVGAIRLLSEAVHDAADDPEAVIRFSGRMLTESERLSHLVQQIIELSRLQGDDPLEHPTTVRLDEVVAVAIDTSAMTAEAKGITLVGRGELGLSSFGDAGQISAAVSNLVSNAVAYSGEGSTVVVDTRADDQAVSISVLDQGIGIPAGEIDRIFERFYRVDPARHRSTGGTGLGLSIVKHVAATHGGEVDVWSVEGQGSTFTLSLPRNQLPDDSEGVDLPPTGPLTAGEPGADARIPSTPTSQEARP